jgi:hypothetical protein
MKRLIIIVLPICLLFSCESINYVPPVTQKMATASGRKGQRVDLAMLQEGRTLFVHRCIECHTLPPFWHYRTGDWPNIIDSMSHRASLKPAERDAVIAYILAARSVKD